MEKIVAMSDWANKAAALPIAFAQVREDPRLDVECCRALPANATVAMIASGGDTAVCLSRLPLGRLLLVDINPAQLALARCKAHLARSATREHALGWLGHRPAPRLESIQRVLEKLRLSEDALGPLKQVAQLGPDYSGRYEMLFAALQIHFREHRIAVHDWLEGKAQISHTALDTAFAEVMSLETLVTLFGPEATQNPRVPFAQHFAERTRIAFTKASPHENPFLWQILAGCFPPGTPWDWLAEKAWTPPMVEPEYIQAKLRDALDALPPESVDFVHLSNILDWLSPDEATAALHSTHRVLKVGGRTLLRQLNSSLDIQKLASDFHWDTAAARSMELRDRSFFYPELHLGQKR